MKAEIITYVWSCLLDIILKSSCCIILSCVSNIEHFISVWFPRWQQFSWSVIVPTAAQSMSGGWHAVEGAQSSNSASSMVPLNSPQAGVRGPVPSTHNALVVWWPSTHDTDGPSFEYLVRTLCYVSSLQCCFALKRVPAVVPSFNMFAGLLLPDAM